ncbi:UNVERIFIED_ORG: hypothetical protein J2Y77_002559 [Pseudomonas lini]|nr:hypothetical protein [Pseudomonas viciae]
MKNTITRLFVRGLMSRSAVFSVLFEVSLLIAIKLAGLRWFFWFLSQH